MKLANRISFLFPLAIILGLALGGAGDTVQWYQPGVIPHMSFPDSMVGKIISPQMSSRHMNQPSVYNGYAVLAGNAAHEIWDISDPYQPKFISEMISEYADGEAESHQITYGRDGEGNYYLATVSGRGVDIWNITNVAQPQYVVAFEVPGINYGDVNNAIWGLSWQGDYLYAGATNHGLFVIDVGNIEQPEVVYNLSQVDIGGIKAGPLFAMGNRLIITTPKQNAGIATLDISQPDRPVFIDAIVESDRSYIGGFYDKHAYLISPLRIYDVFSDPRQIELVHTSPLPKAEYVSFAEDHLFLGGLRGGTHGIYKYDLQASDDPDLLLRITGRDIRWDDQFSCPIGNLILIADDQRVDNQYVGAVIAVHDSLADETPIKVKYIYPEDGTDNFSVSGSIGVSLSEWPEFTSVNNNSFFVRKKGGDPLPGKWGNTYTTINFKPDNKLEEETEYEIVLVKGGIKDFSGNALDEEIVTSFTTGLDLNKFTNTRISPTIPVELGVPSFFAVENPDTLLNYLWVINDSVQIVGEEAAYMFDQPGRYQLSLQVYLEEALVNTIAFVQLVHHPLPSLAPVNSQQLVKNEDEVWVLNPDNHSVSIVSASGLIKLREMNTGTHPAGLAKSPDNTMWVLNRDSWDISIFNLENKQLEQTIKLPYASRPVAIIIDPESERAYISLEGISSVLVLDTQQRTIVETTKIANTSDGILPKLSGMALDRGKKKLFVNRAISTDSIAEIYVINTDNLSHDKTLSLRLDPGPDTDISGRGIPNYLQHIGISPNGLQAWIPSKKDNILRGTSRDGLELVHDNTVRAITSVLDLGSGSEITQARQDFDNVDRCDAICFSEFGDLVFVSLPGNRAVSILDGFTGTELDRLITGEVPDALLYDPIQQRLFVHNFLSRSLSVFDISPLINNGKPSRALGEISLVANELLTSHILRGKRLFYDASSTNINADGYMSCASCHLDGAEDGRTWDFTSLGEGFRNTIDLRGKAGSKHGPLHWTANFDEVHDFENQIRKLGEGIGLLKDDDFLASQDPLENSKSGLSRDLDALAGYVASLNSSPLSPFRQENGELTDQAKEGKNIFTRQQCWSCHGGATFTDSPSEIRHDIGSIKESSGQRMGQSLEDLDTPSLRGIWANPPYLHDGSAPDVKSAILAHQDITVSESELLKLEQYILQIDDLEKNAPGIEVCTNGIDDDGDGAIDQNDADCQECIGDDKDLDGVCDEEDVCPKGDDRLDINANGLPDACECFEKIYEAEYAKFNGPSFAANHPPFSATGFIDFSGRTGDYVSFDIDILIEGRYDFFVGYALRAGDRPLTVEIDGQTYKASMSFPETGDWKQWGEVRFNEKMTAGSHRIRLIANNNPGPNIDYLRVQSQGQAVSGDCLEVGDLPTSGKRSIIVQRDFELFPNPIRDEFNIVLGSSWKESIAKGAKVSLEIHQLNGQLLVEDQLIAKPKMKLFYPQLRNSGVYILSLRDHKHERMLSRLVKR